MMRVYTHRHKYSLIFCLFDRNLLGDRCLFFVKIKKILLELHGVNHRRWDKVQNHLHYENTMNEHYYDIQWRFKDLTLGGGVDFVNCVGGRGGRKSLKGLEVEVKVILNMFLTYFY